jgi:hypothetical protein
MPDMKMGPKTAQLITILDEIKSLLDADGERNWARFIASSKSKLLNLDYTGIEYLLSGYGGMGSFNDLVIGQDTIGGEFRWKEGSVEANDRLNKLRSEAYFLADFIKHNSEIQ